MSNDYADPSTFEDVPELSENSSSSMSRESRKRKWVPGESSASRKQPKSGRKPYAELIKGKSVGGSVKVLTDRLARIKTKAKKAYVEDVVFSIKLLKDTNNCDLMQQCLGSLDKIKIECPLDIPDRYDILDMKRNIKKIVDEYNKACAKAKKALRAAKAVRAEAVRQEKTERTKAIEQLVGWEKKTTESVQRLKEHRVEHQIRLQIVQDIICDVDFSIEAQKAELVSFIRWKLDSYFDPMLPSQSATTFTRSS